MKIIRERKEIKEYEYYRVFNWRNSPQGCCGFEFDCDKAGIVDASSMALEALDDYKKCLNGEYDVIDMGIKRYTHSYVDDAIGICDVCGEKVYLSSFTNECDGCGALYNKFGQQLAPREEWGEDCFNY